MFSGFPSLTTPSIQVWDYTGSQASTSATRSITLTDDCAPIQYFRTGNSNTAIAVYLPISPPEGKVIKVINHRYGGTNQQVAVYYPDTSVGLSVQFFALGVGQTVDFCFSKIAYGFGPGGGYQKTGWMMLNQAGSSSVGYYGISISDGGHASAPQSMVLGGTGGSASASASVVVGGQSGQAAGSYSATVGGQFTTASSQSATCLGGYFNTANGTVSAVVGGSYGTSRSVSGRYTVAASDSPITSFSGISQSGLLVLGIQTTNATTTTLRSNTAAAGTGNQLTLPNNSAYYVRGSCIANVNGGGDTKAWSFEVAIKRGASAAATSIVGAVIKNVVAADAGAATWDITISADTTNGALAVSVTGQAATTIRWVCRLDSTEVTF